MKDNKELREIQDKLLEIAIFIDNICKENNIEYYLMYGTCLGAVRHKGFIPWDDDFDIGMTYDNYLKFINVMENQNSKYVIQTIDNDEEYNRLFAKVRDTETTYIEIGNENRNMIQGLYVDVFPIVGFPNNKFLQKKFKLDRAMAMYPYTNMIKNKFVNFIAKVIYFGKNPKKVSKFFEKQVVKYSAEKCQFILSVFDNQYEENIMDKKTYGKPKQVKFEKFLFPIPENSEAYLTKIYGDYMKIPSKKEIANMQHPVYKIDLETSYKKYMR